MRKVVLQEFVSLDGRIAGPNESVDFIPAQSLIDGRMVDEVRLVLCPVVLGSGRPLFREKAESNPMKLVRATALDRGAVSLIYSPRDAAG